MMCNRFDLAMMRYNEQSTPAVERPTVSEVEKVEKDPIDSGSNTMEGKTVNNDFSSLKVPFPWKLWQMLEDSEKHGTENISAWLPSGDGFTISKTQEFATTLMKAHMQYSSYAAFVEEVSTVVLNEGAPSFYLCFSLVLTLLFLFPSWRGMAL